jgi:hypothetical protein
MSTKDYLSDISEIKILMNKSSKFISISGLTGVFAGCFALSGAAYAYWLMKDQVGSGQLVINDNELILLFIDLFALSALSVGTAIYLTTKKAKRHQQKIWDALTRRLLFNFFVPLIAGGIYTLYVLFQKDYGQVAALMLLFYGLALFSASKYTLGDIKYLGVIQILLGLICTFLPDYGFWFWVTGFGLVHIIYGLIMYFKYDKTQ